MKFTAPRTSHYNNDKWLNCKKLGWCKVS